MRRFIVKNKQPRLMTELSEQRRRGRAVQRFSHTAEELLLKDRIALSGCKLSKAQIISALTEGAKSDLCRVILSDGSTLELGAEKAVEEVYGVDTAIVIAENAAYIETEPWTPTMRYVLKVKTE